MEEKIGKRSGWVTGVAVAQFLAGTALLGICALLCVLTKHSDLKQADDSGAVVLGIKIAILIIAPMAAVAFVAACALAKNKLWGWWLALLADMGFFAIFLYSMIDEGFKDIDWAVFAFAGASLLLVVWLMVPSIRRHYWNPEAVANANLESANVMSTKA